MEAIKKKLLELGMEQTEIDELVKGALNGYIAKEEYDILQGQVKVHEDKAKELSKTVKELQKDVDASEALKLKLDDLEGKLSSKDKEIEKVKFDFKLEAKMKEVGAKNIKAIKALIDMEQVKQEVINNAVAPAPVFNNPTQAHETITLEVLDEDDNEENEENEVPW